MTTTQKDAKNTTTTKNEEEKNMTTETANLNANANAENPKLNAGAFAEQWLRFEQIMSEKNVQAKTLSVSALAQWLNLEYSPVRRMCSLPRVGEPMGEDGTVYWGRMHEWFNDNPIIFKQVAQFDLLGKLEELANKSSAVDLTKYKLGSMWYIASKKMSFSIVYLTSTEVVMRDVNEYGEMQDSLSKWTLKTLHQNSPQVFVPKDKPKNGTVKTETASQ